MPRRRTAVWSAASLVLVLIVARALLPLAVERFVNRALSRNASYAGSVGDVDLALWAGGYSLEDVHIQKRGGRVPVPFFDAERIDLSVQWRALLDGEIVGEIELLRPRLNFVAGPSRAQSQFGAEVDWRNVVEGLLPIRLNRVEVRDGTIHFRNFHSDPPVDVWVDDVQAVAENLTNTRDEGGRVARLRVRARPMKTGQLIATATFDPFADSPDFDFDGSLTGLRLRDLNPFLRAYGAFDVDRGTVRLYAEMLAHKGRFEGYLKPFFEDVDVLQAEELDDQSFFASTWEAIVGAVGEVFRDQSKDRVATRIPLSGSARDPSVGFWATLGNVLRNAFIESLVPRLEHSVGRR